MSEERVRDALAAIADEVDRAPELWERTRRRITTRRRRRVAGGLVASAAVLALAVGSAAVIANDDDGAQVVGTPDTSAPATTDATTPPTTMVAPSTIAVPDVRGLLRGEAADVLGGLGLVVVINGSDTLDGTVSQQDPAPGDAVASGSTVTLTLMLAAPPDSVPDLAGRTLPDAIAVLEAAGLVAEPVAPDTSDFDVVHWQEPPPGAALTPGRPVRLWTCPPGADCVNPPPDYVDGFEPTSFWREIDLTEERWATLVGAGFATADALGEAVAERVRADFQQDETVTSTAITSSDSAEVWVRQRNSPDDSVDGQDYRLHAERRDDGWVLVSGEIREICGRGEGVGEFCV